MRYSSSFSFSSFLASFLVAFFVDVKCINYILMAITSSDIEEEGGFLMPLYIAVFVILIVVSALQKNNMFKMNKYMFFLILYILAWYQYTNAVIGAPRIRFLTLCLFTVVAFMTPSMVRINPKTFIKSVMLLPSIGILYSSRLFTITNNAYETLFMPICYSFLVPVLATIIYLKNYYKEEKLSWKILGMISVLINAFYGYQILSFGPRGPFLCIVSLLLFYILFKKREGLGVKIQENKTFLVVILAIYVSAFLLETLTSLNSLLNFLGVDSTVLTKSIGMMAEGDITNGRNYISGIAVKGILDNPIFGNGFDQFEKNTGIAYPHNFVLQVLYDGGLLFFLILLVPVLHILYVKMKTCNVNEYILIPFFFFISVPGALLSSDMWFVERLWIFFGVVFAPNFIETFDAKKVNMKHQKLNFRKLR